MAQLQIFMNYNVSEESNILCIIMGYICVIKSNKAQSIAYFVFVGL